MNLAKKKSLLIALAIISTFSIMGCGNSNSSSSTTTQTSSQKTPSKAEIAYKAFLDLPMGLLMTKPSRHSVLMEN